MNSSVYYAQRSDGMIKIGVATSPEARMAQLATGAGRIVLLATEIGDRQLEARRHREFEDLRTDGEWFLPGRALLAHIKSIATKAHMAEQRAFISMGEKIALRPEEAAELISVSVPTLYRLMRTGEIPYWQPVGTRFRLLSRVQLERWIAERVEHVIGGAA